MTAALSTDAWRLLVEAEIDTVVRELRKNALWAEVVERDGVGALWVGGSRWPGFHQSLRKSVLEPTSASAADNTVWTSTKIKQYMDEFSSRRSFGKVGTNIGMAAFGAKDDDNEDDAYAVSRIMMLESFLLLREAINGVSDPRTMDPQQLLDPFLLVIRDAETTGPITR
ncbi:hypothetical protein FBU59_005978, partial [Linderina macrospora]